MNRRQLIKFGGAAALWPLPPRAQQRTMPTIGFLHQGSSSGVYASMLADFQQGLKQAGFVDGQNVRIEYRWAEGRYELLPAMAADLAGRGVNVISTALLPAAIAARAATKTIPIVFNVGSDPVNVGLVASFNRPGGNLTGMSRLTAELGPKRLEILHEAVPSARRISHMLNPTNPNIEGLVRQMTEAARTLGVELTMHNASSQADIESAFATMNQTRPDALLVGADSFFTDHAKQISALAAQTRIPAIYSNLSAAFAGGLLAYGGNFSDLDRQFGLYTGRILKGEKPADLPVQQSTRVELIINLKTARALGFTFPLSLLGRADEVIE